MFLASRHACRYRAAPLPFWEAGPFHVLARLHIPADQVFDVLVLAVLSLKPFVQLHVGGEELHIERLHVPLAVGIRRLFLRFRCHVYVKRWYNRPGAGPPAFASGPFGRRVGLSSLSNGDSNYPLPDGQLQADPLHRFPPFASLRKALSPSDIYYYRATPI